MGQWVSGSHALTEGDDGDVEEGRRREDKRAQDRSIEHTVRKCARKECEGTQRTNQVQHIGSQRGENF